MASKLPIITISLIFILINSVSQAAKDTSRPPKTTTTALVIPLQRENTTNLYTANLRKRTPRVTVPLVLDLNGRFLWAICDQNYTSSTYNAPFCHSTQCSLAGAHYCHRCIGDRTPKPGCHNNTCGVITTNPLTGKNTVGELAQDAISFQAFNNDRTSRSKSKQNKLVSVSGVLFSCAPSTLLQGLPRRVQGVLGLGHTHVALPMQLASRLGLSPEFSLCFSDNNNNAIFLGNVSSKLQQYGKAMVYTPLSIGEKGEYNILVRSIKINHRDVPFNTSLFSRTRGFGGALVSTTTPYTVMEHSVYTSFTQFYADEMKGVPRVEAIPPFTLCFNASYRPPTRVGTPDIEFVLQNKNMTWNYHGVDAFVRSVRPGVDCLGFVDGGSNTQRPITIGAYQLKYNFLHFDLQRSRLGFVYDRLLLEKTTIDCSSSAAAADDGATMEVDDVGN